MCLLCTALYVISFCIPAAQIHSYLFQQIHLIMQSPSIELLRAMRSVIHPWSLGCRFLHPHRRLHSLCLHRPIISKNIREISSTPASFIPPNPQSTDRGPISKEDTQTDFGTMDVLGNTPAPMTSIDACLSDGFHLNNGVKIGGGNGCMLISGEAFSWRPWEASTESQGKLVNRKGQWDVGNESWGILETVWPKPGMFSGRP